MSEFQFSGQEKFAIVAVENCYTDLPDAKDYKHQLADETWIYTRVPVTLDTHWKEWLGTIRLERLQNSNLIMMVSEASSNPQVLDEQHQKLKKRLSQTFAFCSFRESWSMTAQISYAGPSLPEGPKSAK